MTKPLPSRERTDARPRRDFVDADDASLVLRAQGGDEWALEALFRRHVDGVTRLVTRLVGRTHDADDAVQDAFAEALRDLAKLREPGAFGAWLHRIAVNRSRKVYRRRRLLRGFGLDRGIDDATLSQLASASAGPEDLAELAGIDRALGRLPTEQRIAWMLRHVEEHSLPEVAALTGCSLATAKRRVAAAESALAAHARRGA